MERDSARSSWSAWRRASSAVRWSSRRCGALPDRPLRAAWPRCTWVAMRTWRWKISTSPPETTTSPSSRQRSAHLVGVAGHADPPVAIHPASHPTRPGTGPLQRTPPADLTGLDMDRLDTRPGQTEPLHRRAVPQRLMRPGSVVLDHPGIQSRLRLGQRGALIVTHGHELFAPRLVEPLDLARGRRRTRCS